MKRPIEKKTAWATVTSFLLGVGITVLNNAQADTELLGSMPGWSQNLITLVGPGLAVFLAGYRAPHTPRPDLADSDEVRRPS